MISRRGDADVCISVFAMTYMSTHEDSLYQCMSYIYIWLYIYIYLMLYYIVYNNIYIYTCIHIRTVYACSITHVSSKACYIRIGAAQHLWKVKGDVVPALSTYIGMTDPSRPQLHFPKCVWLTQNVHVSSCLCNLVSPLHWQYPIACLPVNTCVFVFMCRAREHGTVERWVRKSFPKEACLVLSAANFWLY